MMIEYYAKESLKDYVEILKNNHNIVLTGAPGTGKTYLAKKIAEAMGDTSPVMVQFHPSYDYTDFVEGLRPTEPNENGNIGFERKDGTFKEFCKRALQKNTSNFDDAYKILISTIGDVDKYVLTTKNSKKFAVSVNSNGNLTLYTGPELRQNGTLTKANIKAHIEVIDKTADWESYYRAVIELMKKDLKIEDIDNSKKKYVFIIDEINRGEISKIFGELFFSIDPGYRGPEGLVQTQYQNIISESENDVYKNGFYVPKNVYIIGTMNDIDRSVESMDFAMRRRFTWIEVDANSRIDMWENAEWAGEAEKRMKSLNQVIKNIEGLSSAYHIGPAYFLKLNNYKESDRWQKLWDYHIKPLLSEYIRGFNSIDKKLSMLEKAYNLAEQNTTSTHEY